MGSEIPKFAELVERAYLEFHSEPRRILELQLNNWDVLSLVFVLDMFSHEFDIPGPYTPFVELLREQCFEYMANLGPNSRALVEALLAADAGDAGEQ
jgi:hypothetical protein